MILSISTLFFTQCREQGLEETNLVTIKDIAQKLGVTPATVSLTLNGKGRVSEETRSLIKKAADEMGYTPSLAAVSMRTKLSRTIGVIVGTINNEFFVNEIQAISDVAAERGYCLFICDAGKDREKARENLRALRARGVDGIITSFGFYTGDSFNEEIKSCLENGIRIITLTTSITMSEVPSVIFSSRDQIEIIIDRMVALGHTHIGCLTAEKGSWLDDNRFSLFRDVMIERGVYDENVIMHFNIFDGKIGEHTEKLISSHPEITAVIAINDYVAIQVQKTILSMGYSVPGDISIIGFDGISSTEYLTPTITTIATPKAIGTRATEKLLDWIESPNEGRPEDETIPCTVKWGESLSKNRRKNDK